MAKSFYHLQKKKEFASKELEKIKAEIEDLTTYYSLDVYGKKYPVYDKTEVLQIIDKHISELKGE